MTPTDFIVKLRLALTTDQTHVRVPRWLCEQWLTWLDKGRAAAEVWLHFNEPTPTNQVCECKADMVCVRCSASTLIRRLAYLPPRPTPEETPE